MTQLRILQVIPSFGNGGVEEVTLATSGALVRAGHLSFIASGGGDKVRAAEDHGACHVTLPLNRKSPLLILPLISELASIIREHRIDVVHARSRWPAWWAYYAASRCGVPFVTTFHGRHKVGNPVKVFYNSIMVRTPHAITVSDFMRGYIEDNYGASLRRYHTRIHVIPDGIDPQRFDPYQHFEPVWPGHDKIILLPGRMTRLKGHLVAIEALAKIKTKGWRAYFVGAGPTVTPYQQEVQQHIDRAGLADKITICPAMHNLEAAYQQADLVLCPSIKPEAFGRVVIEAQAMGTPLIVSNIGEPASLVKHGHTGWQFENKNADELAHYIDLALALPQDDLNTYAHNARQHVLDNYTQDLMCQRTLAVYEQAVNQA